MDIGTGITFGTLIIGCAIPVTSWILTRNSNGSSPVTKDMCKKTHEVMDVKLHNLESKLDMLLNHFQLTPKDGDG